MGIEETLQITSVSAPLHGGEYTCVVMNAAGMQLESSVLYVPTEFVTHPESINVTARSNFSLTCIAEGYPYPIYQWQKMNRTNGVFEDIAGEEGTILQFNDTDYADFGMYRCVAYNEIGEQKYSDTSNSALVTVSPEGSILITPDSMTFDYEDEVNLTCTIEGGPQNQFVWYFNDTPVVSGINDLSISNTFFESVLRISSVNAVDHGGSYTCRASNAAGFDETSTMLFISPRIIGNPVPLTLRENGTSAALMCEGEAFPYPEYSWIELTQNQVVGDASLLNFEPIIYEDANTYVCRVDSGHLHVMSTVARLFGKLL